MSNEVPACIEDLANDLWFEIFGYLDWINLFSTFYGINKRINQLLMFVNVLSLYESYLINHSNSIYIFFQEFPLKEFKQIQHFRWINDYSYDDALDISKHFSSFSTLISLSIDTNFKDYKPDDEIAMTFFRQHYPYLQRLYLHGNVVNRDLQIMNNISLFHFPSLLYLHVDHIHYICAIQLLDQCSQLRSFSAKLYDDPETSNTTSSSFSLSTRIISGLTAMKKLRLEEDDSFRRQFGIAFLELLLPCCPNLHTFACEIEIWNNCKRIEADWWKQIF
ncbi:unnamed protein product, partial [Adineta steineri]